MHECCYVIIKVSDIWNNQSPSTATNSEDGIDHYDDDDDDDDDDSLYINIYYLNNTFYIQYIFYLKESPVYGSIQRGDTVLSLYGCQVYNKQNWNDCISKTLSTPQHGYCTDMLTVSRKNSSQGQTAYIVVLNWQLYKFINH